MNREPKPTTDAFGVAPASAGARKRTNGHLSLKSVVAKAVKTCESQRLEQEKKDEEEREFMKLGEAARQQKCNIRFHNNKRRLVLSQQNSPQGKLQGNLQGNLQGKHPLHARKRPSTPSTAASYQHQRNNPYESRRSSKFNRDSNSSTDSSCHLQQEMKRMENRLIELQTKHDAAEANTRIWKAKYESLALKHEERNRKISAMNKDLRDKSKRLKDMHKNKQKLLEDWSNFHQDCVSRKVEYEENAKKLQAQNSDLREECVTIKNEYQRKETKMLQQEIKFVDELASVKKDAVAREDELIRNHQNEVERLRALASGKQDAIKQKHQDELEQARALASAKENAYEKSRKEILQRHQKELRQARASASTSTSTSTSTSESSGSANVGTITRWKEQIEHQKQEHADLQRNFVTIAMQNTRHSTLIEKLQAEIRRLKNGPGPIPVIGGPTLPLKIED